MKKKKIKKKIRQIEMYNGQLKRDIKLWEEMYAQVLEKLVENGVMPEMKLEEKPEFDLGNGEKVYGIVTTKPRIKLDFSKHDADVLKRRDNESNS